MILDADLARVYGVPTKALIQAVRRNLARFPADCMFQLSREETNLLRSQSVTLKPGNRYLIACGLIGEPVPRLITSGGAQKKNS